MKKPLYIITWSIFGIIAGFIFWFLICFASVMRTPPPFDFEAAKNKFYQNREQFVYVADYFAALGCKHICIWTREREDGKKYIDPKELPDDSKLYESMDILSQNDCECFEQRGNTVKFQLWDDWNTKRGILYLIPNTEAIDDTFINLKKICDNWYFYEKPSKIVPKAIM